jgi:hypothetical protein
MAMVYLQGVGQPPPPPGSEPLSDPSMDWWFTPPPPPGPPTGIFLDESTWKPSVLAQQKAQQQLELLRTTGQAVPLPTPPILTNVMCPMDAKSCPDGSVVGRTGPNCEFAPCPTDRVGGILDNLQGMDVASYLPWIIGAGIALWLLNRK